MKNEQLRNFIKVVDCGSINKAAEQLYVSQPSLSRSIRRGNGERISYSQ